MTPGKPMLAATLETEMLTYLSYPLLASAKLDGIRALCRAGAVYSRSLKVLPNRHLQKLFSSQAFDNLDGELIIGNPATPDVFNRTTSAIMSHDGDITDLTYFVFDLVGKGWTFNERLSRLHDAVRTLPCDVRDRVIVLEQQAVFSARDVEVYEEHMLTKGYEGLILRHPNAAYKNGRSTFREHGMMKLKRFHDTELIVVGYEELYSNQNEATLSETGHQVRSSHQANMVPMGTLGALVCQWGIGQTVKVGTGFTATQRLVFWRDKESLIGKVAKIKYQKYGMVDVPRLPVFLGFRSELDV